MNEEPTDGLQVLPVVGIGDVTAGDDLAALIVGAAPWLRDGDVLVVTSKIISKAEGRLVEVPADGPQRDAARERILADETVRVVARRGTTAIVQTRHGFVMAAAGIDASNVDKTHLVLLPMDPDASARALRDDLRRRHGLDVGVIVSDTMGRAWRNGLTDVALGAAGVLPIRDHRGETDPYGNELQLTEMAVIDELAAAGELVKGKCDQVPVAVVRGYPGAGGPDGPGAVALVRDAATDMFSLGTTEARAAGRTDAALLDTPARWHPAQSDPAPSSPAQSNPAQSDSARWNEPAPPPLHPAAPAAVARALATVATVIAPGTAFHVIDGTTAHHTDVHHTDVHHTPPGVTDVQHTAVQHAPPGVTAVQCTPPGVAPTDLIRFGADVHRLRAALAAEGILSTVATYSADLRLTVGTQHPTAL